LHRQLIAAAHPAAAAASAASAATAAVSAAAATVAAASAAAESPFPWAAAAVAAGWAVHPGSIGRCGLSFGHRLCAGYPGLPTDRLRSSLEREGLWIPVRDVVALVFLIGNQEANSRNSVPNRSAEENNAQNSVPWR
jgi:hypothetical protein